MVDSPMLLPLPTEPCGKSWSLSTSYEAPEPVQEYASSSSSSRSDVDSFESTSTLLESPFKDTSPDSPVPELEREFTQVSSSDTPVVAVIGVGYVGLHLVKAFSQHYKVIAFDVSQQRLQYVANQLLDTLNVSLTNNTSDLSNATHFLVAVPTPLRPHSATIDTSIIDKALQTVSDHIRRGATVVIESSVSVGMTRALLSDMVQTHGLYAGMSPEVSRI